MTHPVLTSRTPTASNSRARSAVITQRLAAVGLLVLAAFACSSENDAEVYACYGTPPSCQGLTLLTCGQTPGCSPGGECSGTALDCSTLLSESSCSLAGDCFWLTSLEQCSGGSHLPCSSWSTEANCEAQTGCTFTPTCDGSPVPCEVNADESECVAAPGCTWDVAY